jgi:hypothetical protein
MLYAEVDNALKIPIRCVKRTGRPEATAQDRQIDTVSE